jgi:hypothetical protein
MTAAPLLLFGQLLGIAFAAGLNLYATVALLGLASRLGWITWLPPALRGLENEILIASAAILFFVEFVVDKVPHVDSLWDAIHTFIRPTAAALLALAALGGEPISIQIAGAVFAGGVALAAHGTKAGLRLAINAGANPVANSAISIAEDIAAVALVVAALRFPSSALAIAGGSLAITAIVGPRLWRALVFGFRALDARVRGFFEQTRWRGRDELPRALRELVEPPPPGRAEPRAARASLKGGPRRVGAYRNGWLVITADGPVFLYRSLLGPRKLAIPPIRSLRTRRGPWAEVLELDTERFRCTLFVLRDAPQVEPTLTPFLVSNP